MSVDSIALLHEAEEMQKLAGNEVQRRNAISRLYYAAFHAASSYADTQTEIPLSHLGGGTHDKLGYFFSKKTVFPRDKWLIHISLGCILKKSFKKRCSADYDLDSDIGKEELSMQQEDVAKIFDKINKLNCQ